MRRLRLVVYIVTLGAVTILAPRASAQIGNTGYIIVQFENSAAASYEGDVPGLERTKPLRGRFDPATPVAQAYLKFLDKAHANYRSWLQQNAPGAQVVRDFKVIFNGVAIKLNQTAAARASAGPGA